MAKYRVNCFTLPPRELAKELLRHDSFRNWITDPNVPLGEVVKAIRRGAAGMGGGYPGGYSAEVRGTHVQVSRAEGKHYNPPIEFTVYELLKELRDAACSKAKQLSLWEEQPNLWEEATA